MVCIASAFLTLFMYRALMLSRTKFGAGGISDIRTVRAYVCMYVRPCTPDLHGMKLLIDIYDVMQFNFYYFVRIFLLVSI